MADQKISNLTNYTTPLDADLVPVVDTLNASTKKTTWANIKATLKAYFDTLYPSGSGTSTGTNTGDQAIATSAEVDTGTDNAKIVTASAISGSHNVPHVIPGTSGYVMTSDGTDWVSQVLPSAGIFYPQDLAISSNNTVASVEFCSTSNTDGSVFFVRLQGSSVMSRFKRDAITGTYSETHSITPTLQVPAGDTGGFLIIGSYLYHFSNDGVNVVCSRFLAADLTGEQVMTVPVLTCSTTLGCWTDGTFAWIVSNSSDTVSHKWSVSGTTFTDTAVTGTVTTNKFERAESGNLYDGTNTYYFSFNGSTTITVEKLTNIDGSARTESTITVPLYSDAIAGSFLINIDSAKVYWGFMYAAYNQTAQMSARIKLIPITKP